MADLGETMKKVLLAGIGAAAETSEKAEQLLNDMVKKGELTIEQGKVLNKELKHNIDEKLKSSKEKAAAQSRKPDVSEFLKNLSEEDLRELKARLAAVDLDEDDSLVDDSID
jgi:polyhydroxyalkanoate synthesis regulator phasin